MTRPDAFRWSTTNSSLEAFLRTYFGLLLVIMALRVGTVVTLRDFTSADFCWPVAWMQGWPPSLVSLWVRGMVMATIVFLGCATWRPRVWAFRLIGTLFSFLLICLLYSFGKTDHPILGWSFCSFFLAFCRPREEEFWQTMNARLVHGAICLFFSFYFLAGITKVIDFIYFWQQGQGAWDLAVGYFPRIIGLAEWQNGNIILHPTWLRQPGWVSLVGLGLVVTAELSTVIPMLWLRWTRPAAFMILIFHFATAYVMNVNFIWSALLAVVLLLGHPLVAPGSRGSMQGS